MLLELVGQPIAEVSSSQDMDQVFFTLGVADEKEELLVDAGHFCHEVAPLQLNQDLDVGAFGHLVRWPRVVNGVDHCFSENPARPDFGGKVQHPFDILGALRKDVYVVLEIR